MVGKNCESDAAFLANMVESGYMAREMYQAVERISIYARRVGRLVHKPIELYLYQPGIGGLHSAFRLGDMVAHVTGELDYHGDQLMVEICGMKDSLQVGHVVFSVWNIHAINVEKQTIIVTAFG